MTERLRRALARKAFFGKWKKRWSKPSRMSNSFGEPIGKPVCIRSMRRYERAVMLQNLRAAQLQGFNDLNACNKRHAGKGSQQVTSSKYIARTVRYLKREGRYAV